MKLAKDLIMGDTIKVDLGKGLSSRIIDKVSHKDGIVEILLFTEMGKRPKIVFTENHPVAMSLLDSFS